MSRCSAARHQRTSLMARRFDSKVKHLAQSLYLSIGTPVGLQLLSMALKGNWEGVVDFPLSPSDYSDPEAFRKDYLCTSLVRKFDSFEFGKDREKAALLGFLASEEQCAATNKRLQVNYVNGLKSRITPESILLLAREKIARLLGPFSWDLAEPFFRFGPGATTSVPHRMGDAYYKLREHPSTTHGCAVLSYTALRRIPLWYNHVVSLTGESLDDFERYSTEEKIGKLFRIVPGNRVTFVPKDARKCRTIAIEPTMNGFIQHGIGQLIRRRLKRWRLNGDCGPRIDLDNQELNQTLAYFGSRYGDLVTADLSSASDSVSLGLCDMLLPQDWMEAICLCRSPSGVLPDGSVVRYQKVSSMGCGFTFELESLIFLALARSVVDLLCLRDRCCSAYGDDIVVPVGGWPTLRWMLQYCGFTVNTEKSFASGPFRESCGKHFFYGSDVTPIYIRKDIDVVPRLFWFCNQIRRWSRMYWGLDATLQPTYELARGMLPRSVRRPSIPEGIGDLGLVGDWDEVCPKLSSMPDGWTVEVRVPVFRTRRYNDPIYLIRSLMGLENRQISGSRDLLIKPHQILSGQGLSPWELKRVKCVDEPSEIALLGTPPTWKRIKLQVTKWPSFGPWIESTSLSRISGGMAAET